MGTTEGRSKRRQRMAAGEDRRGLLEFVLDLSSTLVNLPAGGIEAGVRAALERVGLLHGADRSILARFSRDLSRFSLTHEWSGPGVAPVQTRWIGVLSGRFRSILASFLRDEPVVLRTPEDLPAGPGREAVRESGTRSVLLVPLLAGGRLRGFIGLTSQNEERIWSDAATETLAAAGELCLSALSRRKAESALRMMRFSVEHSSEASFWVGSDARFFYVNGAACRLLGYTRSELRDMTVHDIDPLYPKEVWPEFWKDLAARQRMTIESRLRGKDGRERPVEIRISYRCFEKRGVAFALVRDLTEHKEVEEERRRLATAVEHAADGVLITDRQGRIDYVNPAYERQEGRTRSDILGRTLEDLFGGLWDQIRRRSRWAGRIPSYRADGEAYESDVSVTAIHDGKHERVGYVAICRDVTEQTRMESVLGQTRKMEAIGQLAGGVAHDFNNMLQAIKGYTALALSVVPSSGRAVSYLDEVMRAADRAGDLVRQLLTFSRREALKYEYLHLDSVVAGVMKMLRRVIGEHMDLEVRTASDGVTIHGDRGQLGQILLNLCVNARDAMPDGGRIRIRTGVAAFSEEHARTHRWSRAGQYAYLSVSDNGCGIQEHLRERIFEPFFTTKEVGSGTGLGLATVYAIVERHDGLLRVISEPGKGTEFRVFLPVAEAAPVPRLPCDRKREAEGGSETILLAEDDEQVRTLAESILRKAGYGVLVACDGEEAVRVFEHHSSSIDLALLDVVMPRRSGRAVHDTIKDRCPHVPVLFTTGYSYDVLAAGDLPEEDFRILRKPYRPEELLRMVRESLESDSRIIG